MKKFYEGASLVSALFLIITAASIFLFNVQKQHQHVKDLKKTHKKVEKAEKSTSKYHVDRLQRSEEEAKRILRQKEIDQAELQEEIDYYKKMADPIWNYYDLKSATKKVFPGEYDENKPPMKLK